MIDWLRRIVRLRPFAVAAVLLAFGAIVLSVTHTMHYTELSPVDELQHIDYLYRAPAIVHQGDKVGQSAMHEQACRILPNYPSPPCSDTATYNPTDFQETGSNTASVYTPFYYTLTRLLATPLVWIFGHDSLVTAARVVGAFYLAAGLLVTLAVARRFGAQPFTTAAILLAAASTPVILLPSATITPDSMGIVVGASLVWSVLWWQDSPNRRLWLPVLVGVAAVLCKAINVIAVMLVALYVLVQYLHGRIWPPDVPPADPPVDRRPTFLQSALLIVPMSVAALAASVGYVMYVKQTSAGMAGAPPMTQNAAVTQFPIVGFLAETGNFLLVFYSAGSYVTTKLIGNFVQSVTGLLTFAGTFAAAFLVKGVRQASRLLSISLMVVGLVGAPLIVALSYFSAHIYVPIPGRYAITLIPAGLATAASVVQRRPAQLFIAVAGIICYLAVLVDMFIFPM